MSVLLSYYLCFVIVPLIFYWGGDALHVHSYGVSLLYVSLSESFLSSAIWMYF